MDPVILRLLLRAEFLQIKLFVSFVLLDAYDGLFKWYQNHGFTEIILNGKWFYCWNSGVCDWGFLFLLQMPCAISICLMLAITHCWWILKFVFGLLISWRLQSWCFACAVPWMLWLWALLFQCSPLHSHAQSFICSASFCFGWVVQFQFQCHICQFCFLISTSNAKGPASTLISFAESRLFVCFSSDTTALPSVILTSWKGSLTTAEQRKARWDKLLIN